MEAAFPSSSKVIETISPSWMSESEISSASADCPLPSGFSGSSPSWLSVFSLSWLSSAASWLSLAPSEESELCPSPSGFSGAPPFCPSPPGCIPPACFVITVSAVIVIVCSSPVRSNIEGASPPWPFPSGAPPFCPSPPGWPISFIVPTAMVISESETDLTSPSTIFSWLSSLLSPEASASPLSSFAASAAVSVLLSSA